MDRFASLHDRRWTTMEGLASFVAVATGVTMDRRSGGAH
ncbi:hypothetical protein HALDL1_04585 [Halobacterium sp. DL1]|jgi:hypothetical protein|nr:hypothetical protein HALDL1_04585 [Halobacterium sp. DL1]